MVYWGAVDYLEDNSSPVFDYLQSDPSVQFTRDEFGADFVTILTMDNLFGTNTMPNPPSKETDAMIYSSIGAQFVPDSNQLPWSYGLLFGEILFIV